MYLDQIGSCRSHIFHAHLNAKRFRVLSQNLFTILECAIHLSSVAVAPCRWVRQCFSVTGRSRSQTTRKTKSKQMERRTSDAHIGSLLSENVRMYILPKQHEVNTECNAKRNIVNNVFSEFIPNGSLLCRFCNVLLDLLPNTLTNIQVYKLPGHTHWSTLANY